MQKLLLTTLMIIASCLSLAAQSIEASDTLPEIRASLLLVDAGDAEYSICGHAAIRMEYPSGDLDFCFSYDSSDDAVNVMRLLLGHAKGRSIAVKWADYEAQYKSEGRGIRQLPLNLTRREKQRLWQLLDQQMNDNTTTFDILKSSCSSVAMLTIERALDNEYLDWGSWQAATGATTYRDIIGKATEARPWWHSFWLLTLGGTDGQQEAEPESLPPTMLPAALRNATIRKPNGESRPLLLELRVTSYELRVTNYELRVTNSTFFDKRSGRSRSVIPHSSLRPAQLIRHSKFQIRHSSLTPLLASIVLLVAAIVVSLANLKGWLLGVAKIVDGVLLAIQSILGLWLTLMTCSAHSMVRWNPYVVVLNLVPLLLWLTARGKQWRSRVLTTYAAVIAIFLLATPAAFVQTPLHILAVAMLVRCLAKLFSTRYKVNR